MTKKKGKEKRSSILLSKSCKTTLLFHKTCVYSVFLSFSSCFTWCVFRYNFFSFEKRHRKRIHTETFSFSQLFFSALRSVQCSFHWPPFNCIELMHMRKENNQTWSSITNQKPSIKNIVIQIKFTHITAVTFFLHSPFFLLDIKQNTAKIWVNTSCQLISR